MKLKIMKQKQLHFTVLLLLLATFQTIVAQHDGTKDNLKALEEVTVLGSRRAGRSSLTSAAPIDIIDAKSLESSGFTQTIQALKTVLPSFTANQTSVNDGTDYVRPATLRGLGPEHVLVLVNGKRRHTSALLHLNDQTRGSVQVDLNTIPANFIERIEVLRDGAAAQYGSDAIAGVINIILKKSTDFTASVSYGTNISVQNAGYDATEGLIEGETNAAFTKGFYYNDWATGGAGKVTRTHIDGQATSINLGKGFSLGAKNGGVIYLTGQFRRQERSNRAGLDPRMQYFGTDATGQLSTNAEAVRAASGWNAKEATIDRFNNQWYGQSEFTELTVGLNGEIPYRDNKDQLYFNATYSYRLGNGPCFFRRALDDRTIRSKYPNGFLPQIAPIITDFAAALGYKAKLDDLWTVNASSNIGSNSFNFVVDNTANVSLGAFTPSNPFQKTKYDAGTLAFLQWNNNLDVTKTIADVFGSDNDLSVAFGGEVRYEKFQIETGEPGSFEAGTATILDGPNQGKAAPPGCQCFPGYQNFVNGNRLASGIYVDVEADLFKDFTVGGAGRYEYYSDFGSTLNGKLAVRWQFTKPIGFRATVSTGFRAPALSQSYFSVVSTNRLGNQLVETGTFPVNHAVAVALGAKTLQAEKSLNASAGFTANVGDRLKITIDAYWIQLTDRVTLSEDFEGIKKNDVDLLQQYLKTQGVEATRGRYFTNAINTQTWGADVVATFNAIKTANLSFNIILAANYNSTEVTNRAQVNTPEQLKQYSTTPLLGARNVSRLEQYNPKTVGNLTLELTLKQWNFLLRTTYYGEFITPYEDARYNQTQPGTIINGLEIGYKFGPNNKFLIALGSDNIFDVYPVKTYKEQSLNGMFQYGFSPFGFNGRFVYGRVSISL